MDKIISYCLLVQRTRNVNIFIYLLEVIYYLWYFYAKSLACKENEQMAPKGNFIFCRNEKNG